MSLILGFSLPLLVGMLFQQFYSLVDTIIVGKFLGVDALAAVGSTTSIINMIVMFFTGTSIGAGVVITRSPSVLVPVIMKACANTLPTVSGSASFFLLS